MAPPAAPVTGQGTFLFERELSEIIRKLKKIILVWIHGQLTAIHVHIKSVRADGTGDSHCPALSINDDWFFASSSSCANSMSKNTRRCYTAIYTRDLIPKKQNRNKNSKMCFFVSHIFSFCYFLFLLFPEIRFGNEPRCHRQDIHHVIILVNRLPKVIHCKQRIRILPWKRKRVALLIHYSNIPLFVFYRHI